MAARGFGPDGSCGTAGWLDGLLAKSHTPTEYLTGRSRCACHPSAGLARKASV